jgi:hypothetical protein
MVARLKSKRDMLCGKRAGAEPPTLALQRKENKAMTTVSHRAVELIVGFAMLGYCAHAIYSGDVMGRFRSYNRRDEPGSFWATILVVSGIGAVFLFGYVSWRM